MVPITPLHLRSRSSTWQHPMAQTPAFGLKPPEVKAFSGGGRVVEGFGGFQGLSGLWLGALKGLGIFLWSPWHSGVRAAERTLCHGSKSCDPFSGS